MPVGFKSMGANGQVQDQLAATVLMHLTQLTLCHLYIYVGWQLAAVHCTAVHQSSYIHSCLWLPSDAVGAKAHVCYSGMPHCYQVYRHIVLAVHDPGSGCFGGLGISRRDNLMYKPLAFCSLAELIHDYIHAYRYGHRCWIVLNVCMHQLAC